MNDLRPPVDPTLALFGLRVVECGGMVSAPYAAKLLADLGAEVIKVEPPGTGDPARRRGPFPRGHEGDPEASGLFRYLNANKQGITLDPRLDADREALLNLLAGADVFLHNFTQDEARERGVHHDDLRERFPALVHTWITPFGLSGPHAGWQAENLTVVSAGGWASLTPGNSPLDDEPPLQAFGQQAMFEAGVHASVATMGALWARRRSGRGQLVEVSAQECIAAALELALVTYTYTGRVASRLGIRTSAPMEIMECKDGLIFVMTADPHQWTAFVHMMGDPEWASWEIFDDRFKRGQNHDALKPLIEDFLQEHTVQEVFDMAGEARLPFAPVSTMADLVHSPHLKTRGFFVTQHHPVAGDVLMPGAPYLLPDTPWTLRSPAPLLGQHTSKVSGRPTHHSPLTTHAATPLAGIRVIDFSWMWAGPYCTLQLAHLGAEVIRIETHHRPCMNRRVPPYADDEPGLNRAGSFNQWNQGKGSLLLDLKNPKAVVIARELIATADVFVENYAAGVVDRLGLGYDVLSKLNPRLVMASLSGYGLTGPYRNRVAFGTPLTMISGLGMLTGYQGRGPSEVGISYGDPNAGLHAAFAIMAALWKRDELGHGQYIDVSQWEAMVAILPEGVLPYTMNGEQVARRANRDALMAPHGIYRCTGDDRWVSIVVRNDDEWARCARIIGGAALEERFRAEAGRKAHEDELDALVTAWTARRDAWGITMVLQAQGIAAAPAMDMREVAEDPHLRERGFYVELEHPEAGRQQHAGIPWKLHGTPLHVRRPAPCMGEDNRQIVVDLLGHTPSEYERLVEAQVLY
ncbi:MAG: CaiB/BaiF CoA transferase family protein [Dehalococcoidia bacterium]